MKIKQLLMVLLAVASVSFSGASQTAGDDLDVEQGVYKGFVGTPMLKSLGYKAQSGAFSIGVGQGSILNHENITDNDPENYASCTNLADLTLIADNDVKLLVDEEYCAANGITPRTYGPGAEVGFVLSANGSGVSVLDLDVVKLFIIYFYKGDKRVAEKNAKADELDVLGLNLVSVGGGKQKITAFAPEIDNEGNPLEFDGIGFGIGGVDAGVIKQVRLHYGFVDDFELVPIIRKYYPTAFSKVAGMVTGGHNLTNNDITDGATTAVLNVGGAYYTVLTNEAKPFPAGVEAGFVLTAGSVLDLNLGKAVEIVALSYPQNPDGTYDFTAEPIEVGKTTDVNAVGLQLIGGGKTKVTIVTDAPCFGFRLNRISVVNLDLGATVVHYAYVKLPQVPETTYPFEVGMTVVPNTTFTAANAGGLLGVGASKAKNTIKNKISLRQNAERPLKTKDLMPAVWRNGIIEGYLVAKDYVCLTLTRKSLTDTNGDTPGEVVGYIEIIKNGSNYEYVYDKKGVGTGSKGSLPAPGADGVIDLSAVVIDEDATEITIARNDNPANAVKAYEYYLYFADTKDDVDDTANALEMAYDEVVYPSIRPEYEIAGTATLDFIKTADDSEPSESLTFGAARYVKITVPDEIDWKTRVVSFDVYKYTSDTKAEKFASFTRAAEGGWIAAGITSYSIEDNGVSQVAFIDYTSAPDYYYEVVCRSELNADYKSEYGVSTDNLSFGCVPAAVESFNAPVLNSYIAQDRKIFKNYLLLSLNDAKDSYTTDNGDEVLYNVWSSFYNLEARAEGVTTIHSTKFNENDDFNPYYRGYDLHKSYATVAINDDAFSSRTNYQAVSRAYVPVRPAGYGSEATSYLVAHNVSAVTPVEDVDHVTTGVESVGADSDAKAEYYTLQGVRVETPGRGIYIRRQGANAVKVILN